MFRAVPISAGSHSVTFRFQPLSVAAGAALSLLACLVLLVAPILEATLLLRRLFVVLYGRIGALVTRRDSGRAAVPELR
jgi:hypothetical protein